MTIVGARYETGHLMAPGCYSIMLVVQYPAILYPSVISLFQPDVSDRATINGKENNLRCSVPPRDSIPSFISVTMPRTLNPERCVYF